MVSDSKILTVSYGTFSCTLEGFDDPFNTMRSIAEYFRDLAADDRYFGAEPPTPDPQMLSSIAEKEIQRRVEARMQEGGLVLRQMEQDQRARPMAAPVTDTSQPAAAPVIAEAPAPETKQPSVPARDTVSEPAPVETSKPQPASSKAALAGTLAGSSIADKLERIRAAVAQRNQADFAEDQNAAMNFAGTALHERFEEELVEETEAARDDVPVAEATPVSEIVPEIEESAAEDEVVTPEAEAATEDVVEAGNDLAEVTLADAPPSDAPEEADAGKPSRIAAPFQEAAAIIAEMNGDIADSAENEALEESTDAIADAITGIETASETGEEPYEDTPAIEEMATDLSPETDEDVTLGNVLSSLQVSEEAAEEAGEIADEIANAADNDAERHEMDPNLAADIAEATRPVETAEDEAGPAINEPLQRVRARVVKMRRADFEAKTAEEEPVANEEPVEEAASNEAPEALTETLRRELGSSSLDAEDEDELMRELAEVAIAAEVEEDGEIEKDIEDEAPAALFAEGDETEDDSDTRNVFDTSDASMSRLMDEADREMAKGENTRRRNAIQHLKAAVTAIRAEKSEKGDVAEEDEAEVYKEDLARVVRPRRPEGAGQTRRQLPPLMLVSEQRIDTPKDLPNGANITPVRPRRVSRAALAVQETEALDTVEEISTTAPDTGVTFADFAEAQGAESLTDILEAAAAFSSFVQGRETVTRPQIMHLAKAAMPEDVPVEERLRSFGQLLRQGKIRKQSRGQFTVADTTRFKPQ
ncbi:hypothetical protein [Celeribacter ethanolicus]|uniref:hypothetical protein n=1 Tax=Celeribacter ethanolicus TaxID=1758178 RepID=UPI000835EB32|nr:hypothetical protein [Celeribacter ethanolicus]